MPLAHDNRLKLTLTPAAEQFARRRARAVPGGPAMSASVSSALERYDAIMSAATPDISDAERDYLCDILNGTLLDATAIAHLALEVEDAEPEYAEKWGIDASRLAARLAEMPLAERTAIAEQVEAYWRDV